MPKRIQRKRTKGWKMPPNTVYVGRPSPCGNLFKGEDACEMYEAWLCQLIGGIPRIVFMRPLIQDFLKGKDVACWCKLTENCHGDILLEIANV